MRIVLSDGENYVTRMELSCLPSHAVTVAATLTCVEVESKLLVVVALDDAVDELATQRRFRLDAESQRRVHLDVLRYRVCVELLVKYWHGAVDHLDVYRYLRGTGCDSWGGERLMSTYVPGGGML